MNIHELKNKLSEEWNKPKSKNIEKDFDKREARDYNKIEELLNEINKIKNRNESNK